MTYLTDRDMLKEQQSLPNREITGLDSVLRATMEAPFNAYMLIGDEDETLMQALLFSAGLKCQFGGCLTCNICKLILAKDHPDVVVFERSGPTLSAQDARQIVTLSKRSPKSGKFQILIIPEAHLMNEANPILLKTIEEPPPTTIFFLLATHVEAKMDTLRSRCILVKIRKKAVSESKYVDTVLKILHYLDGTVTGVDSAVTSYFACIEENIDLVKLSQQSQMDEFKNSIQMQGKGNTTLLKLFDDQQKREIRKFKNDVQKNIMVTLQHIIADQTKEQIDNLGSNSMDVAGKFEIIKSINRYIKNLERNPNDALQVTSLFIELSELLN